MELSVRPPNSVRFSNSSLVPADTTSVASLNNTRSFEPGNCSRQTHPQCFNVTTHLCSALQVSALCVWCPRFRNIGVCVVVIVIALRDYVAPLQTDPMTSIAPLSFCPRQQSIVAKSQIAIRNQKSIGDGNPMDPRIEKEGRRRWIWRLKERKTESSRN